MNETPILKNLKTRMTSDVHGLAIRRETNISLTFGEVKELVKARPDHPNIAGLKAFVDQFAGTSLPDSQIVITDRKIVEALLDENGAVAVETETVENHRLIKTLELRKPEPEAPEEKPGKDGADE